MHDNAPSHCSYLTKEFLSNQGFKNGRLMEWPSNSPDLNPIENCFGSLKTFMYAGAKQYNSKKCLLDGLVSSVKKLDQIYINRLIKSMDTRIAELFEKKGNFLKY